VTERQTGALERLNQGIQESRREVQQRTMNLAQEYFGDSAEVLKQNIRDNRATLEGLPDQIPGGREEAFQAFFQELMDNYSSMEDCINEAQQNVANLDTDQIRRQGEIEATDAARREARERGVDLTKVEGTGSDGRIIVSDVVEAAEEMEDGAGEDGAASEAVQGAQDAAGQAAGQAQQVAGQVTDQAGQVAGQAQDAAGGVAQQGQQAAQQAQDTVGGEGAEEPKATNAARRKAQEMGVDLSQVQGTGSGGLITLKDVTGS
jgi:pyruvate/2-oxoglutarate dehydrogenase complex dihydrolipoamide acyltransferase (E2) component